MCTDHPKNHLRRRGSEKEIAPHANTCGKDLQLARYQKTETVSIAYRQLGAHIVHIQVHSGIHWCNKCFENGNHSGNGP